MKRLPLTVMFAAILLLPAGCITPVRIVDPTPLAGTTLEGLRTRDGLLRTYRVYSPASIAGDTVPLLVLLHGTGSNSARMIEMADFKRHAETNRYLLVAPDALGRAFNEGAGRIGQEFADVDDVAFIATLITRLKKSHRVSQVFLAGFSSGAAMVQRAVLESPGMIDAAAGVSGHLWPPLVQAVSEPAVPVPLLLLFGDADPLNPDNGKLSPRTTAERWARLFGCEVSITASSHLVRTTAWAKCAGDVSVQLVMVEGLGHFWPGGTVSHAQNLPADRLGSYVGSVNATNIIWRFFLSATGAPAGR
ncbi:MAG: alpha/beta hydrolase family esterase [Pseudomonadota bacterium]